MSSFTFGATPAASTSTGAGGLFGSAAPKPAFGGFSTPNPQQQQPAAGGGLFGAQPNQPAPTGTSTGLFGSSTAQPAPQAGGGLFGGAPTGGGGLFGQQPQQQQQQQQGQTPGAGSSLFGGNSGATGGGLFGQAQAQPQQKPAGTGLFGSTAMTPSSGGLFGSTAQPGQQQAGTGLFGSTAQSQQPAQSSLFGGFGQSQQPQQQQQQQPSASTSIFGAPPQPLQQQPQAALFGSVNAPLAATSNLGASAVGLPQRQEQSIEERMMAVQRAWDPSSPDCRFKYFFYNVVEPGTTYRYGRPAAANDDVKWAKAVRENPDPNSMVPALAVGWGDVKKRVQLQEQIASVHQEKIKFIPILQSTSFRPEEAETRERLESIKSELDGRAPSRAPGARLGESSIGTGNGTPRKGQGRMLGQVNELWGAVEEIRRRRRGGRPEGREAWLADEKVLAEVAEVLAQQQLALQKLTELVQNAVFDADVMRQGLGLLGASERER
ncbi:hypothetical protein EHS25_008637 [Saitozyma podzolica]|uniref:Nucleoporin Nup54 alpha-helical domain-containing protein n=1 Tax=Saitozyma podzolica TaxID=1890683 RepID=A0A427YM81_9TREE|nr:hypothetical protein EHS25_008637 [Saitozyma podzolica]